MTGANQAQGMDRVVSGDMSDNVREQVTRTLRELGFAPGVVLKPTTNHTPNILT
jgi:hypothetical protein